MRDTKMTVIPEQSVPESRADTLPANPPPQKMTSFTEEDAATARELRMTLREDLKNVKVELQVVDSKHATSEEVLQFCIDHLQKGGTYNVLRLKLGLGPSMTDRRWRRIRAVLAEMILPDTEEEALKLANSMSNFMITKIEVFMEKIEQRALASQGEENEAQFLKLELDAMKMVMDKYEKQTEHFLKMKDIKKKEKGTQGPTIIFNNKFVIPRPGAKDITPLSDAADLINMAKRLEGDDEA